MATATAGSLSAPAREFIDWGPKRLVIGGESAEAADGRTFETIDPATGEAICEVAFAGPEDVERATAAARAALEGPLRKINPAKRSSLMHRLAELIKEHGDELAELESLDNGKPLAAAKGDIAASVNHLRYYAGWPTKIEGETIPVSARDVLCYTLREPVGVCAQIVPWNYPLLMAMWKVAPALAAGCAIVLKPARQTPLTALFLTRTLLEAGLPENAIQCVTGPGAELGRVLCADPRVRKISFTGSTAVGEEITRVAGVKRLSLELGANCPMIVLPDADLDRVATATASGGYVNAGQVCISVQRVLVARQVYGEFVERLTPLVRDLRTGHPLDEQTGLGPVISEAEAIRVERTIRDAVDAGATLVTGGERDGAVVAPSILGDVDPSLEVSRGELFGPAVALTPVSGIEEAIALANDSDYGLGAGLFTSDLESALRFATEVDCGSIQINSSPLWRSDPMPYGGLKGSGIGKEGPSAAIDEMTELKTVVFHRG